VNPKHIAVILDGNRRYAEAIHLPAVQGHALGFQRLKHFLEWCKEEDIREVTIYTLSTNNLKREKSEVKFLLTLFREKLQEFIDEPLKDTTIRFIGNRALLPKDIQAQMAQLEKKTKGRYKLNVAMAYDGRDEILRAIKKAVGECTIDEMMNITEWSFSRLLDLQSEPDLIIRTGETRLSGFLLWQASYSELIFLPEIMWPAFQKKDFRWCLEEYKKRNRKYGR
jgi:undecaprenyl diphosphate synthase